MNNSKVFVYDILCGWDTRSIDHFHDLLNSLPTSHTKLVLYRFVTVNQINISACICDINCTLFWESSCVSAWTSNGLAISVMRIQVIVNLLIGVLMVSKLTPLEAELISTVYEIYEFSSWLTINTATTLKTKGQLKKGVHCDSNPIHIDTGCGRKVQKR